MIVMTVQILMRAKNEYYVLITVQALIYVPKLSFINLSYHFFTSIFLYRSISFIF